MAREGFCRGARRGGLINVCRVRGAWCGQGCLGGTGAMDGSSCKHPDALSTYTDRLPRWLSLLPVRVLVSGRECMCQDPCPYIHIHTYMYLLLLFTQHLHVPPPHPTPYE